MADKTDTLPKLILNREDPKQEFTDNELGDTEEEKNMINNLSEMV